MALEELITKLTAALDANTAAHKASAGGGAATTPKAAAAKPSAKAEPKIDFDAVKVLATKVMEQKGRPLAKKLITDVGGAKELSGVKPDKFPALAKAFESVLEEGETTDEDGDEDEL